MVPLNLSTSITSPTLTLLSLITKIPEMKLETISWDAKPITIPTTPKLIMMLSKLIPRTCNIHAKAMIIMVYFIMSLNK